MSTKTGPIKFYDTFTGTCTKEFNDGNKYEIKFTSDENKLIIYKDNIIKILNVETLEIEKEIINDTDITCLDVNSDGTKIVIGEDSDTNCRIIDLESGESLFTLRTINRHNDVRFVCFDPNSNKFLFDSSNKELSVVDLDNNELIHVLSFDEKFNKFSFSPDGTKLVLCFGKSFVIKDSTTYETLFTINNNDTKFWPEVFFSPDSSTIALINSENINTIYFYDTITALKLGEILIDTGIITIKNFLGIVLNNFRCLNFDESGTYILFAHVDGVLSVDVRNGDIKFKIEEKIKKNDSFISFPKKSIIGSYI